MTAVLKAETRVKKKSVLHKLRRNGYIPAVLYGDDIESQPISVDERTFSKVYREVGRSGVFTLEIQNDSHPVMIYDVQVDPIKNEIIHADFLKVNMNEEVDAEVPVQLVGESPGAKEGGIVQQLLHSLNVRALPANLPTNIEISIEQLNIGDSIAVSDVKENFNFTILHADEEVIVSILAPSAEATSESDESLAEEGAENSPESAEDSRE